MNTALRAYSLLEVVLALAILGGAIAVLGEAARQAFDNASRARHMAVAQLLCESKMVEIIAGIIPAETAQGVAREACGADEPAWLYRIESESLEEDGLLSVRVSVSQDLPAAKRPVAFSLVRWVSIADLTSETGYSDVGDQGADAAAANSGTGGAE